MNKNPILKITVVGLALFLTVTGAVLTNITAKPAGASPEEKEVQELIKQRESDIKKLEQEIAQHSRQIESIRGQARTLESTLREMEATRNKLTAEISLLEQRINQLEDSILSTTREIQLAEIEIANNKESLTFIIRELDDSQSVSALLRLFSHENFSEIWQTVGDLRQIQDQVTFQLAEIQSLKQSLDRKKEAQEKQRSELAAQKEELGGRHQAARAAAQEQENLLYVTQSEESRYQALIAERRAAKERFEQELFEFESRLNPNVDRGGIPAPRPGLLSWPLDNIFITQQFGVTAYSGRLYASGSHNGVDFRASVGTPIRSVAAGVVEATGNTDLIPGCLSYGQWILIRHNNGLSSMYAHLSVTSVSKGQSIERGQIIGFSGNTGFSTGPHLHLTIYATQGVSVQQYLSSRGCQSAFIPMAHPNAHLDPMVYLPPYNSF